MATPNSLSDCSVAVLGLGLMGGSLALALRGGCARLIGIDPDAQTLTLASRLGLADELSDRPDTLLPQADLIVLAAPVGIILTLIKALPEIHPGQAVVLDLGSTKRQIVEAMASMPSRFDPIGGHPMCGKEQNGLSQADPDLYREAVFALTPLSRSSANAIHLAEQLVFTLGARPLWLDPRTHDLWAAATSHLPFLIANALAAITPKETSALIGPGFRSTTRLAPSSWQMMRDILATNRENILTGLRRYRQHLEKMERLLEAEKLDEMGDMVARGAQQYRELIGGSAPPEGRSQ